MSETTSRHKPRPAHDMASSRTMLVLCDRALDMPQEVRDLYDMKVALSDAIADVIRALDEGRIQCDSDAELTALHELLMAALDVILDGRLALMGDPSGGVQ